jgi:hypothetical protein
VNIEKEHALETYRSLIQYGQASLKCVLTANGTAAIAVLTFLGHFVASERPSVPDLRLPLGLFLAGVLLGGVATATAYSTQLTLYNESLCNGSESTPRSHVFWLKVSIALVLLGMACFGAGAALAVFQLQ